MYICCTIYKAPGLGPLPLGVLQRAKPALRCRREVRKVKVDCVLQVLARVRRGAARVGRQRLRDNNTRDLIYIYIHIYI